VLPNGLTLIVHEDHKAPIVAVSVWYRAGSRDERAGRSGFAHLYEHLMFVGSEHHDDEFFRPMRAAGATDMSGHTQKDLTHYYQNVPTGALDLALWLESDRMGHFPAAVSQEDLDAQRGVVKNEKRQYQNLPYGGVYDLIAANTYPPEHPYSRVVSGSLEDLDAATLDDIQHWFRTYNGAANAIVVVAGDITASQAREKVERYFGDVPAGPLPARPKSWVAKMSGEKRLVSYEAVSQPRLYLVWNIPGYATRDHALLELAARMLGDGKSSRLYRRLVQGDGIATEVEANVSSEELGSQFSVIVTLKLGGDMQAAQRAITEEIDSFLRVGPTIAEMKQARSVADAHFTRRLERINAVSDGGKSWILGSSELFGGSPDFYKQLLDWVHVATPLELRAVMQEWLSDGAFVLEVQPTPPYRAAAASVDRDRMPEPGAPSPLHLPPLQRLTLSNGLEVVLAERHGAALVDFTLMLDAGNAADGTDGAGTAAFAFDMLDEGAGKRSATQIAERADELGIQLAMSSSLDASFVELGAMGDRLDESLALLGDMLIRPTFPQDALERVKQQRLADIKREQSDPKGIALRLLPGQLYGAGHAYASPLSGIGAASVVSALRREDIEAFHRRWIRPDNATLLIVGDTTREVVTALLERHLSAWRAPAAPLPTKNVSVALPAGKSRVLLVHRPGAEQSMIVVGNAMPSLEQEDSISAGIVNALLGGLFISRLNMNLREDKHWAYVVKSRLVDARGSGAFLVEAPVQADKSAEAMREILNELRDITDSRPPTQSEVQSARNSLALALPGLNETTAGLSATYRDMLVRGLPDSHWSEYPSKAAELTPVQLGSVAKKLVRPDELVWVVVGDLTRIEDGIRKLGIGPVSVVDADGNVVR
jgi:zinc protease